MSNHANSNSNRWDSAGSGRPKRSERDATEVYDGVDSVEAYETDNAVVLFDAHNPLAWLEATTALPLKEQI